jgi:hypothetical protein
MKNFAILSREKARQTMGILVTPPKHKHREGLGKITMKDPKTGKVVKEFDSIEQATAEGFNMPNLVGAIKGNKKFKGHLWSSENELT